MTMFQKRLIFGLIALLAMGFFALQNARTVPSKKFQPRIIDKTKPTIGLVHVARVIDGDTIEIEGGERVRYIGMNTPETVDPRRPVQCFGKEASNKNKELVEGKDVRLEKDVSDRDKYGRLLRYVFIDKNFINLELVKKGFAQVDTFPPDVKYEELFRQAQRDARQANLGLWSTCK